MWFAWAFLNWYGTGSIFPFTSGSPSVASPSSGSSSSSSSSSSSAGASPQIVVVPATATLPPVEIINATELLSSTVESSSETETTDLTTIKPVWPIPSTSGTSSSSSTSGTIGVTSHTLTTWWTTPRPVPTKPSLTTSNSPATTTRITSSQKPHTTTNPFLVTKWPSTTTALKPSATTAGVDPLWEVIANISNSLLSPEHNPGPLPKPIPGILPSTVKPSPTSKPFSSTKPIVISKPGATSESVFTVRPKPTSVTYSNSSVLLLKPTHPSTEPPSWVTWFTRPPQTTADDYNVAEIATAQISTDPTNQETPDKGSWIAWWTNHPSTSEYGPFGVTTGTTPASSSHWATVTNKPSVMNPIGSPSSTQQVVSSILSLLTTKPLNSKPVFPTTNPTSQSHRPISVVFKPTSTTFKPSHYPPKPISTHHTPISNTHDQSVSSTISTRPPYNWVVTWTDPHFPSTVSSPHLPYPASSKPTKPATLAWPTQTTPKPITFTWNSVVPSKVPGESPSSDKLTPTTSSPSWFSNTTPKPTTFTWSYIDALKPTSISVSGAFVKPTSSSGALNTSPKPATFTIPSPDITASSSQSSKKTTTSKPSTFVWSSGEKDKTTSKWTSSSTFSSTPPPPSFSPSQSSITSVISQLSSSSFSPRPTSFPSWTLAQGNTTSPSDSPTVQRPLASHWPMKITTGKPLHKPSTGGAKPSVLPITMANLVTSASASRPKPLPSTFPGQSKPPYPSSSSHSSVVSQAMSTSPIYPSFIKPLPSSLPPIKPTASSGIWIKPAGLTSLPSKPSPSLVWSTSTENELGTTSAHTIEIDKVTTGSSLYNEGGSSTSKAQALTTSKPGSEIPSSSFWPPLSSSSASTGNYNIYSSTLSTISSSSPTRPTQNVPTNAPTASSKPSLSPVSPNNVVYQTCLSLGGEPKECKTKAAMYGDILQNINVFPNPLLGPPVSSATKPSHAQEQILLLHPHAMILTKRRKDGGNRKGKPMWIDEVDDKVVGLYRPFGLTPSQSQSHSESNFKGSLSSNNTKSDIP